MQLKQVSVLYIFSGLLLTSLVFCPKPHEGIPNVTSLVYLNRFLLQLFPKFLFWGSWAYSEDTAQPRLTLWNKA